tara:strand:- start:146 stop:307 length:162 start_codon:yes stop_codon:yes gene_type:complete
MPVTILRKQVLARAQRLLDDRIGQAQQLAATRHRVEVLISVRKYLPKLLVTRF